MASVQEIETQVQVLTRKVNMLMNLAQVSKREESSIMPGEYIVTQISLNDLYRELSNAGALESFNG
jgi:hypothetical protein